MNRRTKIVCTLGPAVDSKDKIRALIDAGMNVARLNCSHGDWEAKHRWVKWIREMRSECAPVAVLVDLQGPKFRIGNVGDQGLDLRTGETVRIGPSENAQIPIPQGEIFAAFSPNVRALLGDGEIELKIGAQEGEDFSAKVITGGLLRSKKGITLVNRTFESSAITAKDLLDVQEAANSDVDYIALSYVRHASDVRELRRVIDRLDPSIGLCAKIETREAIKDLDEILKIVDLVMVARGDMGLQMDIDEVPVMQKRIIEECTWAGKPVITATQMLESMIENPRPTRAEATDVFNAILDGTDAVMLSGETAMGRYPIECVKMMVKIAARAEAIFDRTKIDDMFQDRVKSGVSHTDAVAHAVSGLEQLLKPKAILTSTTSGQTARLVSKFRPKAPILCSTWDNRTQAKLAVVWGVEAIKIQRPSSMEETFHAAIDAFFRNKRLKLGDQVLLTTGVPPGTPGNTNLILIETVR